MELSVALLVIDVQIGAFDGILIPAINGGADLLARIGTLVDAARNANAGVTFVQHNAPEGELLTEGTKRWAIHPSVEPGKGEIVIEKRQSSAFASTDLRQILDEGGITTVICCGLQSEHCVTATCLSALELGLDVIVVEDGHSTWTTEEDEASVVVERQNSMLEFRGARVEPAATLVQWLSTSLAVANRERPIDTKVPVDIT